MTPDQLRLYCLAFLASCHGSWSEAIAKAEVMQYDDPEGKPFWLSVEKTLRAGIPST